MKKITALAFAWVIAFHGQDYGSVIELLNSLPSKSAKTAKIFECRDMDMNPAICVAYDNGEKAQ